jgi:hypothetical protein
MRDESKFPFGLVAIAVIMFFVALATDIFWLGKWLGGAFRQTMPLSPKVYNAFSLPDLALSILLYIGAYGLLRRRKFGFALSLVAMGMWIFDSLLVLGMTKLDRINIVGPSLFFAAFSITYIWLKREIFR